MGMIGWTQDLSDVFLLDPGGPATLEMQLGGKQPPLPTLPGGSQEPSSCS